MPVTWVSIVLSNSNGLLPGLIKGSIVVTSVGCKLGLVVDTAVVIEQI